MYTAKNIINLEITVYMESFRPGLQMPGATDVIKWTWFFIKYKTDMVQYSFCVQNNEIVSFFMKPPSKLGKVFWIGVNYLAVSPIN
jgi:hypothetical protein